MKTTVKLMLCLALTCSTFLTGRVAGQTVSQGEAYTAPEMKNTEAIKALVMKAEVASADIGEKMKAMYAQLFKYLGEQKVELTGAPFAIYYKYEPTGNTTFEVGIPVKGNITGTGGMMYKEYPAMKVVSSLHTGPYEKVGPTYQALQAYIQNKHLSSTGISWEVYLTDPSTEHDPMKYQTLIYFPVL